MAATSYKFNGVIRKTSVVICTCLVIVLGSFQPITRVVSNNSDSNSVKNVPFTGRFNTSIQILGAPPIQPVRSSGSGIASHLGKSTFEGNGTVNFTVTPAQITGTATFTAANGDQFYTTYSGTTSIINGQAVGNFVHEITGGTGRFENITGTLTANSVHTLNSPRGTLDFTGAIDY